MRLPNLNISEVFSPQPYAGLKGVVQFAELRRFQLVERLLDNIDWATLSYRRIMK
jgi:hypothetical protein